MELSSLRLNGLFQEGDYSMIFVLPNKEGTLPEVEDKLSTMSLRRLLNGLSENKVEVTIPKFSLEMTINLKDTLSKVTNTEGILAQVEDKLANMSLGYLVFCSSTILQRISQWSTSNYY